MGSDLVLELATGKVDGYVALPEASEPRPGVLVFHEIFGLNEDIRRIADRVASLGYVAIAPNLMAGGLRCVMAAMRDLRRGRGPLIDAAEATVAWAKRRPEVDPDRIGVIGFCMGGGVAFLLGVSGSVKVVAPNYGEPPLDRLAESCPVVASYGARDRMFAKYADRVEEALAAAGIPHDVKRYPEAGHSFMNDAEGHRLAKALIGRPLMAVGYVPEAAEDAWRRIEAFFSEHL